MNFPFGKLSPFLFSHVEIEIKLAKLINQTYYTWLCVLIVFSAVLTNQTIKNKRQKWTNLTTENNRKWKERTTYTRNHLSIFFSLCSAHTMHLAATIIHAMYMRNTNCCGAYIERNAQSLHQYLTSVLYFFPLRFMFVALYSFAKWKWAIE